MFLEIENSSQVGCKLKLRVVRMREMVDEIFENVKILNKWKTSKYLETAQTFYKKEKGALRKFVVLEFF